MSQMETSRNILHAARDLFAEKGFSNITTRQIARRAGVNEVTLFRHFGTKAALYEAVFDHFGSTSGVYASFEKDNNEPPEEVLLAFGLSLHAFFCRNEPLIRMEIKEQSLLKGKPLPVSIIANRNKKILADYMARVYDITEEDAMSLAVTFLCSLWGIFLANHVFQAFSPEPDSGRCVTDSIRSMTGNLSRRLTGGPQ
jgi:TetR/AcrR family transcriptional repressor of mexJK operon